MSYIQFANQTPNKKRNTAANVSRVPGLLNYPTDLDRQNMIISNDWMSDAFAGAITDGTATETMEGAATVDMTLSDVDRKLVNKGILSEWVKASVPRVLTATRGSKKLQVVPSTWNDVFLTIDNRDFTLVKANKTGNQFELTFENRGVNEMRQINKPKVWYRDVFTRAMVIQSMTQEVSGYYIAFFSPELHKLQPIVSAKKAPTPSQTKITKGRGFSPKAKVTVKHAPASLQQKSIIGRVIKTGESMGSSYKVIVSAIMTITQESDVSLLNGSGGYGPFSQLRNGAWPASVTDVEADAHAYFVLAIKYDRQNPNISFNDLCQKVQASGVPNAYGQWEAEAKTTLSLWGSGETGKTLSLSEFNRYAFTRGREGQRENSWVCGSRLASEVNWRLFFVDNTCYYVTDNDLLLSIPWDDISEDDAGIDSIDWEIDTGKAVNQCTVLAHTDAWKCPAGTPVYITDEGPVQGRWLTHQIERPLFSSTAEITLQLPQPPKKEPAPTTKTISVAGTRFNPTPKSGHKGVDAVYAKAQQISAKNYPYIFAGGGYPPGFGATSGAAGGAIGYDCTGYVSACLHAGNFLNEHMDSSALAASWGDPGEGKLMTVWATRQSGPSGHGFIEFKIKGAKWKRADTVPDSSGPATNHGPHVRLQWPPPEPDFGSMVPRHWPGT